MPDELVTRKRNNDLQRIGSAVANPFHRHSEFTYIMDCINKMSG